MSQSALCFCLVSLFTHSLIAPAQAQELELKQAQVLPQINSSPSSSLQSPNVSANALFWYRDSNFNKEDTAEERNGLDIREAELAFYADVDPYSRLLMILSVHPEYTLNSTTNRVEQEWAVEAEELYAESSQIPSINFKVGKFKAAFGKHNPLHTHTFPLVEAPLANTMLLGEEGLNDVGISAAALLPSPWFSELSLQYLRGEGENAAFNSPTPGDGVGLARLKNLFELNEALTLELGASYAGGNNSFGSKTSLSGADLTFKWRPTSGGRYRSWTLAGEYIHRTLGQYDLATSTDVADEAGDGYVVWSEYQFLERWAGLLRYDTLDVANANATVNSEAQLNGLTVRMTYGAVFRATEFSQFRVEYAHSHGPRQPNGENEERQILVQANFTIGAHPAHAY